MAKEKFDRTKPHVNVGTIGHNQPGSITPHQKFKGEVYVSSRDEGGRHTPFFKGYRPQFYFRTTDGTGVGAGTVTEILE